MQHYFQRFAMTGHMGLEHNVGVHRGGYLWHGTW